MEKPQLLRVVLPGGQDQVVASQTQGPLNGWIERPVQHHIVHPWGLNELRKLHVPQQPELGDCRVPEVEGGCTATGLKRMTRRWTGRRGGVRGGEAGPRPRLGGIRRGPWPLSKAAGGSGLGQAGACLLRLPVPPGLGFSQRERSATGPAAAAATWGPGFGWAGWEEKEKTALGPVSKSQALRTPGGSSCSQPGPRATPGGSRGARNSEDRKSELEVGPAWVRRECLGKHRPSRRFVFLPGRSSSLPSYPPLYPNTLHTFLIRKGQRRWEEKRSLTSLPPLEW